MCRKNKRKLRQKDKLKTNYTNQNSKDPPSPKRGIDKMVKHRTNQPIFMNHVLYHKCCILSIITAVNKKWYLCSVSKADSEQVHLSTVSITEREVIKTMEGATDSVQMDQGKLKRSC